MNEREIYLIERSLEGEMTNDEKSEFDSSIHGDETFKVEYEEQKRVKEVLSKMKLKNPSVEIWDSYWLGIYNRVERGIAWIAISIGALILIAYGSYEAVKHFLNDTDTPFIIKFGTAALVFGGLVLLFSVLREKLIIKKSDKYREIQR